MHHFFKFILFFILFYFLIIFFLNLFFNQQQHASALLLAGSGGVGALLPARNRDSYGVIIAGLLSQQDTFAKAHAARKRNLH